MDDPEEQIVDEPQKQRIVIHHTRPAWTREERAGFGFVIGAGFLALIIGGFYMTHHLSSPFFVDYTGPQFKTEAQKEAELLAKQKEKDTDADTLSDYDELYTYKTSPYLSDTDGDRLSDAAEIQTGTDPKCPTGGDCATTLVNPDGVSGNSFDEFVGEAPTPPATLGASPTMSSTDVQSALLSVDAGQVRQLLVQAGASQEQIDALSDEQILSLYQSVLADVQTQQAADSSTTAQ